MLVAKKVVCDACAAGRKCGDGGVLPALAVPGKVVSVDNADADEMDRESLVRWPHGWRASPRGFRPAVTIRAAVTPAGGKESR